VMAKDVRQSRWLLLGYLGVILLAYAQSIQQPTSAPTTLDVSLFLVVLVGMLAAGLLIQADSPTRADAFWASRPFDPTAVLASKALCTLLVLVVPALIAQAAVLVANGAGSGATRARASTEPPGFH